MSEGSETLIPFDEAGRMIADAMKHQIAEFQELGRKEERAIIAAWIRAKAEVMRDQHPVTFRLMHAVATSILRGDHLK